MPRFYIEDELAIKQLNGREFDDLDIAISEATKSARRGAARATHRSSACRFVMEAIPGKHETRAMVYADGDGVKIERH